jgi:hypothetical protein
MKDFKELAEFKEMLKQIPSESINEKKLTALFNKLKKQLGIEKEKELSLHDRIYLQPFKLEYVGTKGRIKNYMVGIDTQRKEKSKSYSKLVKKNENGKLEVIKSFDRVEKITDDQFNKLVLLVRLSQYANKARELYSLEISMLQLFKK